MTLAEIRTTLLNHPSKEFLTELLNASQNIPAMYKTAGFMALNQLSDEELPKFCKVIAVGVQYIEQGDFDALNTLVDRLRLPKFAKAPLQAIIKSYVANLPSQ